MPPSFIEALDNMVKADLLSWRDMWFHCLLWSTGAVAIGLAFEGPELYFELSHIRLDRRDRRMFLAPTSHEIAPRWKMIAFVGWILIVLGVVGEGIFEAMVSRTDGQVQTFNNILLETAQREAGAAAASAKTAHDEADAVKGIADEARADAKDALAKARAAQHSLAEAESDAARAQAVSSNALGKATEAESHLNEALKRAAEATAELKRLASDRSLTNVFELETKLRVFKGTEYTFSSAYPNQEARGFLRIIDGVLQAAGWKPLRPSPPMLAIPVIGSDGVNFNVTPNVLTGIKISVEFPNASLQSIPRTEWPVHALAAITLNVELSASISPRLLPENESPLQVSSGTSMVVKIDVGHK